MPRNLTAGTLAQLTQGRVYPAFFAEIDFASGPVYLWSGIGTVSWNAQSWIGVGTLGKIAPMTEDVAVAATGCTLSLSGIPGSLISDALLECRQGKAVKLWLGFLDSSGNVIVDPAQAFAGLMDVPTAEDSGDTCTIAITVESRLIDLNRSRERDYTQADQQIDYPGDNGFEFVPAVQDWNGVWGKGSGVGGGGHHHPPGGGGCPCLDQWISAEKQVGELAAGDALDSAVMPGEPGFDAGAAFPIVREQIPVRAAWKKENVLCYQLRTGSGVVCEVSWDTPITQPDGSSVLACRSLGASMLTDCEGVLAWSRIKALTVLGRRAVMAVDGGGRSFAHGCDPKRRGFTHNMAKRVE